MDNLPAQPGATPFAVFLQGHADGETHRDLTEALQHIGQVLNEAVYEDGVAKAKLTLELTFVADAKIIMIKPKITVKDPEPQRAAGYAWTDKDGNFTSQPVAKQQILNLREAKEREASET